MQEARTSIRVRYAETDAMGIVHHAVYPVWMELGRSDWFREQGQGYATWEAQGVLLAVVELKVRFRASAHYDELVEVRTRLLEGGRRKVVFGYEIVRGGQKLVEGETVHLATDTEGRSRTMPDHCVAFLQRALAPTDNI